MKPRIVVLALAVMGLVLVIAASFRTTSTPGSGPECLDQVPACPEPVPANVLEAPWNDDLVGLSMLPPAPDDKPSIDSNQAVDIAWKEDAVQGTQEQATLVIVAKGGTFDENTLAWVVRYDGACIAPIGGRLGGKDPGCAKMPYWTMINAKTGAFVMSWTHSEG